jgi:hypothetical protein
MLKYPILCQNPNHQIPTAQSYCQREVNDVLCSNNLGGLRESHSIPSTCPLMNRSILRFVTCSWTNRQNKNKTIAPAKSEMVFVVYQLLMMYIFLIIHIHIPINYRLKFHCVHKTKFLI